jgi:hypothetical protein
MRVGVPADRTWLARMRSSLRGGFGASDFDAHWYVSRGLHRRHDCRDSFMHDWMHLVMFSGGWQYLGVAGLLAGPAIVFFGTLYGPHIVAHSPYERKLRIYGSIFVFCFGILHLVVTLLK